MIDSRDDPPRDFKVSRDTFNQSSTSIHCRVPGFVGRSVIYDLVIFIEKLVLAVRDAMQRLN